MAKNACSPSSTYGGFSQTLFLGCSVTSFTSSVGWNEQASQLTVGLVYDPCTAPAESPKVYYDASLSQQTTTAADPGFLGESGDITGCPAYFRMGDFEFSGLISSWTKSHNSSGHPTYNVVLTDPREILSGSQVIIGEYAGGINSQASGCVAGSSISPYNIFNVFGYMEQFGVACPEYSQSTDGPIFGTPAGGFGGSNINSNGMQWSRIKTGFNVLVNSGTLNQWSPHGGIVYKGPAVTANYGLIAANYGAYCKYYVDISNVGTGLPSYYRLSGMNVSIMDMINQASQDSGHDYYVQLMPCVGGLVISVSVIDRTSQPSLNAISSYVSSQDYVISKSIGRESRNEPTSAFIVGGKKQTVFQASSDYLDMENDPGEEDDIILPFFGLDSNKDMIIPTKDVDDFWEFTVETWDINQHLGVIQLPATVTINEKELLFAEGGFDGWASWIAIKATDTAAILNNLVIGLIDIDRVFGMLQAGVPVGAGDAVGGKKNQWFGQEDDVKARMQDDVHAVHAWVAKFAREYYGKQFAVRVPYTCGWFDSESAKITTSSQPSDGGWTELSEIIGLPNDGTLLDFFKLDDGRIGAFVRFDGVNPGEHELADLPMNDIGIYDGDLYIRANVESEYVYHDWENKTEPRLIITLATSFLDKVDEGFKPDWLMAFDKLVQWGKDVAKEDAEAIGREMGKIVGAKEVFDVVVKRPNMPDAAACPISSNILCYGPWAGIGAPGQSVVKQEDGLVPWEYGGCATMSTAGNLLATEGLTNMTVAERGTVTVPGYPTLPLGSELGALDAGFFGAGTHLYENRSLSSSAFNENDYDGNPVTATIYGFSWAWDGSNGPSVTDISVDVGTQGIQTTYNFRTFAHKFGRMAKVNANLLKTAGQGYYALGKKLRAWQLQRFHKGAALARAGGIEKFFDKVKKDGRIAKAGTPHRVLVGQIIEFTDGFKRPQAATVSMGETPIEMDQAYDSKAFMSLDGLIRPISMDGDGNLPRYAQSYLSAQQYRATDPMIPPFYKEGVECVANLTKEYYAGKTTDEFVTLDYLNPVTNPNAYSRNTLAANRSATPNVGHDFDVLGRIGNGTGNTPEDGLVMPVAGYSDETHRSDYVNDYRFLGLRGPLIVGGWGYDTQGKPIPNYADTESSASQGTFSNIGLTSNFLDGHLRKSHTWPVGPVDLRWDRSRRVWTIPPSHRLCRAVACERFCSMGSVPDVEYMYFWAKLLLGSQGTWDDDGNEVLEGDRMIKVYAPFDRVSVYVGENVLVYYDSCDDKYYLTNQSDHTLYVEHSGCSGSGDAADYVMGGRWPVRTMKFGSGLRVTREWDPVGYDIPYHPSGDSRGFCDFGMLVELCPTGMYGVDYNDNCETGETDLTPNHIYHKMHVGKGLIGKHMNDDEFNLSLGFKVDDQVITSLGLCDCFELRETGECEATLCLSTGTGDVSITDVEVITNAWLDSSGTGTGCSCVLNFETTFLKFTNCGLFLGTGETVGITGLDNPVDQGGG